MANQAKKDNYINQIKTIKPEDCIYLDETGSCLDATLNYGRSPRGERVYAAKPTAPGERLSVIAVLTGQGITAEYLYRGTLTAKVFLAYLETYLLTLLAQGKTLIMDNLPAQGNCIKQPIVIPTISVYKHHRYWPKGGGS